MTKCIADMAVFMFFSFLKLRAAHKKYSKYATSKPSNSLIKSNDKKRKKNI